MEQELNESEVKKREKIVLSIAFFILNIVLLPVALMQTVAVGGLTASPYFVMLVFFPKMDPGLNVWIEVMVIAGSISRIAWSRYLEKKRLSMAILSPFLYAGPGGSSSGEI